jgi:hypothetical protein
MIPAEMGIGKGQVPGMNCKGAYEPLAFETQASGHGWPIG